jgi:hypothetical protein
MSLERNPPLFSSSVVATSTRVAVLTAPGTSFSGSSPTAARPPPDVKKGWPDAPIGCQPKKHHRNQRERCDETPQQAVVPILRPEQHSGATTSSKRLIFYPACLAFANLYIVTIVAGGFIF